MNEFVKDWVDIPGGNKPGHRPIKVEPSSYKDIEPRGITTYHPASGILLVARTLGGADDDEPIEDDPYVDGFHDAALKYVVDGVAVDRPSNPTLLTGTTLYNVPLPSLVRVADALNPAAILEFVTTDGTVELDFPVPGLYGVEVCSFPHLDVTFRVVVT